MAERIKFFDVPLDVLGGLSEGVAKVEAMIERGKRPCRSVAR